MRELNRAHKHPFWEGVRDMALVAAGVAVYGLVFGSLAQQGGFTLVQALGMSLIVYSGSAQLVVLPLLQSGAPLVSIATTVLAISLRHVVMGLSLAPALRGVPLIGRLLLAYAVNDETYAVTTARIAREDFTPAYLAGAGLITFVAWVVSTWVGHAAGQLLPPPEVLGLDFAFTALFIALLAPQIDGLGCVIAMAVAALVSALLAPAAGLGVAVAVGGVLGALAGSWRER